LIYLLLTISSYAVAGDAVAVGYNADGARDAATRDLQKRDIVKGARVEIISSSDATGFVAVARGADKSGKEANVVGRGQTKKEAEEKAFAQLKEAGATKSQQIVYRYFSYGETNPTGQ
jgi:methylaspartate ammonia-lyase